MQLTDVIHTKVYLKTKNLFAFRKIILIISLSCILE